MKPILIVSTLTFLIGCSSNDAASKIDNAICDTYNVYYNSAVQYFLVSKKNTPSGSFYIWNTSKGLYLNKTGGRFYDDGPYSSVAEAIEGQKSSPYFKIYTWSEHKKNGNTLIENRGGTVLSNLCD